MIVRFLFFIRLQKISSTFVSAITIYIAFRVKHSDRCIVCGIWICAPTIFPLLTRMLLSVSVIRLRSWICRKTSKFSSFFYVWILFTELTNPVWCWKLSGVSWCNLLMEKLIFRGVAKDLLVRTLCRIVRSKWKFCNEQKSSNHITTWRDFHPSINLVK